MKQRAITSIFIVLVTFLAIIAKFLPFTIGEYIFDIFILIVAIVAGFEISNILEKTHKELNKFLATMYPIFNYIVLLISINNFKFGYLILAQTISLLIYGLIIYIYEFFAHKEESPTDKFKVTLNTLIACIYPSFWFCLILGINHADIFAGVKYFSLIFIVLVIAITYLTDTCAYLIGSTVKGPKLAPKISPKKTISGAIGGLIGGVLGAMLVYVMAKYINIFSATVNMYNIMWWQFMLIGLFGSVIGQAGDLFESYLKRRAEVKDSGNIFPGHGGMLDRIDAMTFVIITVFVAVLILIL